MKLTEFEVIDQGGPAMLKAWLMAMNMDAKAGKAIFRLKGPCTMQARGRLGAAKTSVLQPWSFKGDESLSIQSVYEEPDFNNRTTTLRVSFIAAPASLGLLKGGFASMSLELNDAFDRFEGLEEWVGEKSEAAPALLKGKEQQTFQTPVKVEEHRESEDWGAW